MFTGDPKYRVPKLDPLTINELRINQGTRQVGLKLYLKNCQIYGLGSAKFVASRYVNDYKSVILYINFLLKKNTFW